MQRDLSCYFDWFARHRPPGGGRRSQPVVEYGKRQLDGLMDIAREKAMLELVEVSEIRMPDLEGFRPDRRATLCTPREDDGGLIQFNVLFESATGAMEPEPFEDTGRICLAESAEERICDLIQRA